MNHTPLKRGEKVRLLDEPGRPEIEIEYAGGVGFKPRGRIRVRPWSDRGKTWSSEVLDRQDAARHDFRQAATGGERTEP